MKMVLINANIYFNRIIMIAKNIYKAKGDSLYDHTEYAVRLSVKEVGLDFRNW